MVITLPAGLAALFEPFKVQISFMFKTHFKVHIITIIIIVLIIINNNNVKSSNIQQ